MECIITVQVLPIEGNFTNYLTKEIDIKYFG